MGTRHEGGAVQRSGLATTAAWATVWAAALNVWFTLCRVLVTLATCLSRRDKQTENAPAKNETGALVFIILMAPDQKEDKQHREQFGAITEEKLDWTEIAHQFFVKLGITFPKSDHTSQSPFTSS